MKTPIEAIRRMGNPYAKLSLPDYDEDSVSFAEAIRRSGNPYAKLSAVEEDDLGEPKSGPEQVDLPLFAARVSPVTRIAVTKTAFETRCRAIFLQYEPLHSGKRPLRLNFRNFIEKNRNKSPEERGQILESLLHYDLSAIPGFKPHLNREKEAALLKKLDDLTNQGA